MVKKAKLDILDIELEEEIKSSPGEDISSEENENDQRGGQTGRGGFFSQIAVWACKPLFWIIIGIISFIGFSGVGLSVWFFYKDNDQLTVKQREQSSTQPAMVKMGNIALFEGFIIDLKDEKSNTRIVLCDIAIELNGVHDMASIENRVDARNAIYLFLKNRKPSELLSTDVRNRLKEDFKNDLNRFFGEELVSRVYFARIETI